MELASVLPTAVITATSSRGQSSRSRDRTRDRCVPRLRWMPEHSMQMRAPRLRLAQSGPEKRSRGGEGDSWGGQHAAHTGLPPLPNISHTIPHHGHPSGSHPGQRHRRLPGILLSSEASPRSLRRTPRWACHPRAMVPPLPLRQGPWQQAAGHLPAQPEEGGSRCCRMPFLWSPELFPASAPGNCRGPPGPLPHQLLVHPAPGASGG